MNVFEERLRIAAILFAARYPAAMHLSESEIQTAMDQTIAHAELLMERHRSFTPGDSEGPAVFSV